jgi:hypothetical protein
MKFFGFTSRKSWQEFRESKAKPVMNNFIFILI